MKIFVFVAALGACGDVGVGASLGAADMSSASIGHATSAVLAEDMSRPVIDMTWDPTAYGPDCNTCPSIGTGGHSLK